MIRNYLLTISSRYLTAFLNLAIVLLSSHFLGAEGLGFASMFVLGITLNQQLCSFFGGSALVYLTPRSNLPSLILISYSGTILVHCLLIPAYILLKPFDIEYLPAFFLVSIISSLNFNNLSILLGKEKVETYNIINVFQVLMQGGIFALFAFHLEKITVSHYIIASGVGYFMALAASSGTVFKESNGRTENKRQTFISILKYGFFSETGNVLQLLSYRLNYFVINKWLGMAALGEFSLAVQLTESLRIFSKGIATVEYSYYSNTDSFQKRTAITKRSVVVSVVFTFAGLIILLLLPSSFILTIFGQSFPNIKTIIAILAPGILFLSAGTVIAPYFSGQGKHYINAIGSAICFVITAVFSFLLIPFWGLNGSALVNTIAYTAITVYLYLIYRKSLRFS